MPGDPPAAPVRVAVVGVGSAATHAHLPTLEGLARAGRVVLVGVCDRREAHREPVLAAHPEAAGFAENDAMLDATRPDLLVIATPPSAHLDETAAAAARGVHVLCEKPLGLATEDVTALASIARDHPALTLATVHQYRYATAWRWMARAATGAVAAGEPFTIDVRVDRPGTDPLSAGGWRSDREHEGGILGDHAVHYLALLRLVDPGCVVVACERSGPGGREEARVQVRIGAAGVAVIAVSYAGAARTNLVRLDRPAQCLEMAWTDGRLTIVRNGRPAPSRSVASLSDRAAVNALYAPMYDAVVRGLDDDAWRAAATAETLGTARLLADAIRLAG